MQIVCAVTRAEIPVMGVSNVPDKPTTTTTILSTEYDIEKQRGTWNRDTIKWWVTNHLKEEIFEQSREIFLRRIFNIAFTEVDIEIPIIFIQAESEDDADIVIDFTPRAEAEHHSTNTKVLAYAGYPDGVLKGIMVIFTDWDWNITGNLNIISVIIHELLHLLGRPHSERKLWKDIMDPAINSKITELSDWDVLGLTTAYGTREYHHDTGHDRLEKANRHQKERLALQGLKSFAKE